MSFRDPVDVLLAREGQVQLRIEVTPMSCSDSVTVHLLVVGLVEVAAKAFPVPNHSDLVNE